MDLLTRVVAAVGLVVLLPILLGLGAYALQTLIRVLRHWDTEKPPPAIFRGSIFGVQWEIHEAAEASDAAIKAVEKLEQRVRALERDKLRTLMGAIAKRRQQRDLPRPKDK